MKKSIAWHPRLAEHTYTHLDTDANAHSSLGKQEVHPVPFISDQSLDCGPLISSPGHTG